MPGLLSTCAAWCRSAALRPCPCSARPGDEGCGERLTSGFFASRFGRTSNRRNQRVCFIIFVPLRFFIDLLEPVNYGIGEPGFSIRRWCISVPLCQVFESPHHCEATRRAGQAVLGSAWFCQEDRVIEICWLTSSRFFFLPFLPSVRNGFAIEPP